MHYPTHWYLAGFLALVLHFFIWVGATFLIPLLLPVPEPVAAGQEIQWEGDTLGDEGMEEAESQPEPAPLEEPPPVTPQETPEEEPEEETTPLIAENEDDAIEELQKEMKAHPEKAPSTVVVVKRGGSGGQMAEGSRLVEDFYPASGIGVNFKGRVTVFVTIGKDGLVKKAQISRTSGKDSVDQLAMSAARRWRFKPALDQHGKPMESMRVLSIPFNVPNIERQRTERKYTWENEKP